MDGGLKTNALYSALDDGDRCVLDALLREFSYIGLRTFLLGSREPYRDLTIIVCPDDPAARHGLKRLELTSSLIDLHGLDGSFERIDCDDLRYIVKVGGAVVGLRYSEKVPNGNSIEL